ncbi:MAG: hypothetical protein ACOC8G_02920, partial [Thermodesulfobacteriota bacterium]
MNIDLFAIEFVPIAPEPMVLSKTGKFGGAGFCARQTMGSQGRLPHQNVAPEKNFNPGSQAPAWEP